VPPKTIKAIALAFAINFAAQTTSVYAQAASHESQQTLTPDPSELSPAPSTWRGAFTDSLRLLLVEHTTRVAFQGKTRRELSGNSSAITNDRCGFPVRETMAAAGL
jgi:hypothetical protein